MPEKTEVNQKDLKAVLVKWSDELNCPVYIHEDGRMFVPMTGQFAGYYEEVKNATPKE
jgi:hypothetical protein